MAKFAGRVGYGLSEEDPEGSGIWVDKIVIQEYYGDVGRKSRGLEPSSETVIGDITVDNSISIVADQFAIEHFLNIRFVEWASVFWTVNSVRVEDRRLILGLGGVYNGPTE